MIAEQPQGLIRELAELVQDVGERSQPDVDSVLAEMTVGSLHAMPAAQHSGITLVSRDGKVESAAASSEYPTLLDDIQQRHDEGPCLSAAWEQHVMRVDDIEQEQRWPNYCRDAVRETPIRAVISYRLFADHNHIGALNFYAEEAGAFDEDAAEMGYILASHTAVAWGMARRDEQFRSALASRDIIGQAKGMIMERFTIDAVQAFELLKRLSQSSNTPLVEVARQLVEAEHPTP